MEAFYLQDSNCSEVNWKEEDVEKFRWLGVCIGFICIIFGTLGNTLTIITLKNESLLKTAFYTFLLSMSGIDLISASLIAPLVMVGIIQMKWPFGGSHNITVDLLGYFYYCSGYTSVVHLVVITIHRFTEICQIQKAQKIFRSPRIVLVLVILSWILAPLLLLPLLIGNHFIWNPSIFMSTLSLRSDTNNYFQEYSLGMRILFQVVPLLVMPPLYCVMFQRVKVSSNRLKRFGNTALLQKSTSVNKNSSTPTFNFARKKSDSKDSKKSSQKTKNDTSKVIREKCRQKKRVLLCLCVCLSFAALFFPSAVVHVLRSVLPCIDPRITIASVSITWLNPVVNPFVYGILNTKMRYGYRKVIKNYVNWLMSYRQLIQGSREA